MLCHFHLILPPTDRRVSTPKVWTLQQKLSENSQTFNPWLRHSKSVRKEGLWDGGAVFELWGGTKFVKKNWKKRKKNIYFFKGII